MKRLLVGTTSQTVSSITTVLINVLAARSLDSDSFGLFAVAMAVGYLLSGVIRALTSEVLLFHFGIETNHDSDADVRSTSAALGLYCALIVVCSLVAVAISSWLPLVFALAIAGSGFMDTLRLCLVYRQRPSVALLADVVFLVSIVLFMFGVPYVSSMTSIFLNIAFSSLLPVAISLYAIRLRLSAARAWSWLLTTRSDGKSFVVDFISGAGASQGTLFLVAWLAAPAAAGGIRVAQVILSPINLVLRALAVSLAPELRRIARGPGIRMLVIACVGLAAICISVCAVLVVVVLNCPEGLVERFFGETTESALSLLPITGCALAFFGVAMSAGLGLRAAGLVAAAARTRVMLLPVLLASVFTGVLTLGAWGSQAGLIVSEVIRGGINWHRLLGTESVKLD